MLELKNRLINTIILIASVTLIKACILYFFYQKTVDYTTTPVSLVSGYGWNELVASLFNGRYEMVCQSGLNAYFDFSSASYRPPIYPLLLYGIILVFGYNAFVIVLINSFITTMVAYMGSRIVSDRICVTSCIAFLVLFLFPLNFMKSSTLDEAPLALLFLFSAIYYLLKAFSNTPHAGIYSFFAGIFFLLSFMTRFTSLFTFGLVLLLVILQRMYKKVFILIFTFLLFLVPWLVRNYLIYNDIVLSVGSGRILLVTQSKEFIENFPEVSIDVIEREYYKKLYFEKPILRGKSFYELDKYFKKKALESVLKEPHSYLKSLIVKFKVFYPQYYPVSVPYIHNLVYSLSYVFCLIVFFTSLVKLLIYKRTISFKEKLILLSLAGSLLPAVVFFMLSRHMYIPMMFMLLFTFIVSSLPKYTCSNKLTTEVIN